MASETFRSIVKYSLPFFFSLAVTCFVLIFLIAAGLGNKNINKVDDLVRIQQDEQDTWGAIPGSLNYDFSQNINLYGFTKQTAAGEDVSMTKTSELQYSVARNFDNTFWYAQKSVISYNLTSDYTLQNPTSKNADIMLEYPNLGSLDVWYQMSNKPKYQLAWQALTQSSNTMYSADLLFRFYGYNAYTYMFNNRDDVNAYVFAGVIDDVSQQDILYQDEEFGLGSINGLYYWSAASNQNSMGTPTATTTEYMALVSHFGALGIDLTPTIMKDLCGPNSMLLYIQSTIYQGIRADPALFQSSGDIDFDQIIQAQWGFSGVINSHQIRGEGIDNIYSVAQIYPYYPTAPEFGAWLLDNYSGDISLGISEPKSQELLAKELASYTSLLNIQNVRYLYSNYDLQQYYNLETRFGFESNDQIDKFMTYLDYMIDTYLLQGTDEATITLGTLLYKQINATVGYLEESLPITVASRVMASNIAASGNQCDYYVSQGPTDQTTIDTICNAVDLSNPNSLETFINATWYGSAAEADFIATWGWTAAEYSAFWDESQDTTFGYLFAQSLGEIATQYSCKSTTNCTSEELAAIQWGSSYVTRNPASTWSATYMPVADSVMAWGTANPDWFPYNVLTTAPEYSQYKTEGASDIVNNVAIRMMSSSQLYYGLMNKPDCQTLLMAYFTSNTEALTTWGNFYTNDGADPFDLAEFWTSSRANIQSRFFGSAYTTLSADQLLFGFYNTAAVNLNGGDFYNGDDFSLSSISTPIFHDKMGNMKDANYGMDTGANSLEKIGVIRILNDQAFVNRQNTVWDGVKYTNYTLNRPLSGESQSQRMLNSFSQVSFGMQFPPGLDETGVKLYNQRNVEVEAFDFDSETSLGDEKLSLYKYKGKQWAGDIGFATNMNLVEEPYGCYGCSMDQSSMKLLIDGVQYEPVTEEPDNFVTVQPQTGYMYQTKKQSTVFLTIGGMSSSSSNADAPVQTPFPDLDPLVGYMVPLFDISENLQASNQDFLNRMSFVASSDSEVRAVTITMSVLAGFFLILGIVALVMHKLNGGDKNTSRDDLLERHMDE